MGRLENILPSIKPGKINKLATTTTYDFDDKSIKSLVLKKTTHQQFIEFSKGSYSIKEICMLIYDRNKDFSFTDIYLELEPWAALGAFKNSEDILDAIRTRKDQAKPPAFNRTLTNEELLLHLRKVSLFANLPPSLIQSIIAGSEQKTFKPGELLIQKGTVGEESFVLLSGTLAVYDDVKKGHMIATLPTLSVFGESAAVTQKPRTADVVATTECQVLVMHLRDIVDPQDGSDLNKNLRVRLIFSQLMKTHPLFRNFPGDVIQMLLGSCRVQKVPAHQTILQQGESGQDFYFILSGGVQIVKDRLPEASLSVGSYFGEVGVLQKQVRTASVVTESESTFLVLSQRNFINLLASNFALALEIERSISSRTATKANLWPEFELNTDKEITSDISASIDVFKDYDFSSHTAEGT